MRKIKAWTSMALAAALAFSLAGCGASEMSGSSAADSAAASEAETTEDAAAAGELGETENPESGEESGTRVIVDHTGAEIEIPAEIDRIVISSILPLPSVYCLFEGSAEKLVGMHPSSMAAAENSILPKVMPDILDVNTDFLLGGEINVEELMNLKPDVVFYSADNWEEYEKISSAGIPAIGFSTSNWNYDCVATFENWVTLLGEVLNQEDKAAGIAEY